MSGSSQDQDTYYCKSFTDNLTYYLGEIVSTPSNLFLAANSFCNTSPAKVESTTFGEPGEGFPDLVSLQPDNDDTFFGPAPSTSKRHRSPTPKSPNQATKYWKSPGQTIPLDVPPFFNPPGLSIRNTLLTQ